MPTQEKQEKAAGSQNAAPTPGPWEICRDVDEADFSIRSRSKEAFANSNMVGDYRGVIVCDIAPAIGGEYARAHAVAEAEANARLITAAPGLLAEIESVRRAIINFQNGHQVDWFAHTESMRRLIEKATGQ